MHGSTWCWFLLTSVAVLLLSAVSRAERCQDGREIDLSKINLEAILLEPKTTRRLDIAQFLTVDREMRLTHLSQTLGRGFKTSKFWMFQISNRAYPEFSCLGTAYQDIRQFANLFVNSGEIVVQQLLAAGLLPRYLRHLERTPPVPTPLGRRLVVVLVIAETLGLGSSDDRSEPWQFAFKGDDKDTCASSFPQADTLLNHLAANQIDLLFVTPYLATLSDWKRHTNRPDDVVLYPDSLTRDQLKAQVYRFSAKMDVMAVATKRIVTEFACKRFVDEDQASSSSGEVEFVDITEPEAPSTRDNLSGLEPEPKDSAQGPPSSPLPGTSSQTLGDVADQPPSSPLPGTSWQTLGDVADQPHDTPQPTEAADPWQQIRDDDWPSDDATDNAPSRGSNWRPRRRGRPVGARTYKGGDYTYNPRRGLNRRSRRRRHADDTARSSPSPRSSGSSRPPRSPPSPSPPSRKRDSSLPLKKRRIPLQYSAPPRLLSLKRMSSPPSRGPSPPKERHFQPPSPQKRPAPPPEVNTRPGVIVRHVSTTTDRA